MSLKPIIMQLTHPDYQEIIDRYGHTSRFLSLLKNMAFEHGNMETFLGPMLWDAEAHFSVCVIPGLSPFEVNAYVMRRDLGEPDFRMLIKDPTALVKIRVESEETVNFDETEAEFADLGLSSFKNQISGSEIISQNWYSTSYVAELAANAGDSKLRFLKSLKPNALDNHRLVQGMQHMSRICGSIDHKNVIKVFEYTQGSGFAAIMTEFINGCDLGSLLIHLRMKNEQIPIALAVAIAAEVASGLHCLHTAIETHSNTSMRVEHRGLIPGNILLGANGRVVITDLTMSKSLLYGSAVSDNVLYGYFPYMSPERMRNEVTDARCDVFSLGAIFWEMIAMRRLFVGDCAIEIIQTVKTSCVANIDRPLRDDLDDELWIILKNALVEQPSLRYASAAEFETALRGYMHRTFGNSGTELLCALVPKVEERAYKPERLLSTVWDIK